MKVRRHPLCRTARRRHVSARRGDQHLAHRDAVVRGRSAPRFAPSLAPRIVPRLVPRLVPSHRVTKTKLSRNNQKPSEINGWDPRECKKDKILQFLCCNHTPLSENMCTNDDTFQKFSYSEINFMIHVKCSECIFQMYPCSECIFIQK